MEMLMKETVTTTATTSFLHKQSINNLSTATNKATTSDIANRKKAIKNTSIDQVDFEKLIASTNNLNKLNNTYSPDKDFINENNINNMKNKTNEEEEEDDDDFIANSSSTNFKKSTKNIKSKSLKENNKQITKQKSVTITNEPNIQSSNLNNINTNSLNNININNNNNNSKQTSKKNKKPKKKKSHSIDEPISSELLTTSKSSLFPKMPTAKTRNNESNTNTTTNHSIKSAKSINRQQQQQQQLNNAKKKEEETILANLINESLRWDRRAEDAEEERKRIDIYKQNRRKRYIEQRNKMLNLTSNHDTNNLYSNSIYENEFDDYENNSNDNGLAAAYLYDENNREELYDNNPVTSTSTTNLSSNVIFNKMKIKERSNITDSAISSMSSNSR